MTKVAEAMNGHLLDDTGVSYASMETAVDEYALAAAELVTPSAS